MHVAVFLGAARLLASHSFRARLCHAKNGAPEEEAVLDQFGVTSSSTESNGVHLGSSGSWYIVSCLLHQASLISGTSSFVWGVFGFRRKVLSQDLLSNIFS